MQPLYINVQDGQIIVSIYASVKFENFDLINLVFEDT